MNSRLALFPFFLALMVIGQIPIIIAQNQIQPEIIRGTGPVDPQPQPEVILGTGVVDDQSQPQPQPVLPQPLPVLPRPLPVQPQPQPARPQPQPQPVRPLLPPVRPQPQPVRPQGPIVIPQVSPPSVSSTVINDACLQCLCQASTGCKPLTCHLNGPSQYYCGTYLISWAYWADAGKPGDNVNNPYAFEECLNNPSCAATTVRQYMGKYGRDCDGNGIIDCRDIGRIHKAGPGDCQAKWVENTPYWNTFSTCAS